MRTAFCFPSRAIGAVVAATCLAFVAGCGTDTDEPTGRGTGTTSASPENAPSSHPTQDTSITAETGERFTLVVDENVSTGEKWYLAAPKPDSAVVRDRGQEYEASADAEKMDGAGGHRVFTFEAAGKGSTKIVLMHCPVYACNGSTTSPAPATDAPASLPKPKSITYTVTVG
ncbi:protease inhibitor I42 family protein [Streptomyces sp. NPDC059786]|uniref:protease inhibitor I42 family protein n=1 Tax=Streptomyces sp. NPDC059786 TaxID=3346946 RepID=UPI0036645AC6